MIDVNQIVIRHFDERDEAFDVVIEYGGKLYVGKDIEFDKNDQSWQYMFGVGTMSKEGLKYDDVPSDADGKVFEQILEAFSRLSSAEQE